MLVRELMDESTKNMTNSDSRMYNTCGPRFVEPSETQISASRWCTQTHLFSLWRTACVQPSDSWGSRACGRRTTGGQTRRLCCPEGRAGREESSSDWEAPDEFTIKKQTTKQKLFKQDYKNKNGWTASLLSGNELYAESLVLQLLF